MSLYTGLEKVKAGNREDLLSALANFSDFDLDFNGENGLDYLWDEVWEVNGFENIDEYENQVNAELKYESNLEWLLDKVKDIEDDGECIETFFETWMEHDRNYYDETEVNYIRNKKGKVIAVSFAVNGRS